MPHRPNITTRQYLLGAGFSLVVALLLLGLMLYKAETLVRLGLIGNFWYFILVTMGMAVAVFLFLGFKSYASYTGKVLNGKLELSGPPVVMLVVIILGFMLVPKPLARFDLTVFVHGEGGRQDKVLHNLGAFMKRPVMELDLANDRRREPIGDKGEFRFVGIPNDQLDKTTTITLDADGYELVKPKDQVKLSAESIYVAVRPALVHLRACEKIKRTPLSFVTEIHTISVISSTRVDNKFSRCQTRISRACFQNYPQPLNCKTRIPKHIATTPTHLRAC